MDSIRKILKVEDQNQNSKDGEINSNLYLTERHLVDYLNDVKLATKFASENRNNIVDKVYCALCEAVPNLDNILNKDVLDPNITIDTPHNYIERVSKYVIIRKGAIKASKNQKVLIPLNMRDGAVIGVGKGNKEWNNSAPHGAGRVMSRTKAKENVSLEDFKETMKGVFSNSICDNTIDESPFAYKSMEEILENIQGNIEIKNIIKPIYNFKAVD